MNYHLAIDQGTHASRAILYDSDGQRIAQHHQDISLARMDNGFVEQQPTEILQSVLTLVRRFTESLPGAIYNRITHCGIACQRSTIVACNLQGKPLRPAISWQDTRGEAYLSELPLSPAEIQKITGLPCSAHYAASKLRWLLEQDTQIKTRPVDSLLLAPLISYLLYHLLETKPADVAYVVDHSQAQRMQLLDLETCDWSDQLLSAFKIPRQTLPLCRPMRFDYGNLCGTHIPVRAIAGDQNAALLGVLHGRFDLHTCLVNLGSGAFLLQPLKQLRHSTRLLTSIFYSDGHTVHYCREATVNGAGNALSWLAQQDTSVKQATLKELSTWLESSMQDSRLSTLFVNSVGQLGSPWWCASVPPHFLNEKQINRRERYIAVLESILFLVQINLDIMHHEQPVQRLIVSGGLARIPALCQKMANLSQLPVSLAADSESTARGVAWLASESVVRQSLDQETENMLPDQTVYTPRKESGLRQRYQLFQQQLTAAIEKYA